MTKIPEFERSHVYLLMQGNYAELLKHSSCGILKLIKSRTLVKEIEIVDTPEFRDMRGTVIRVFDSDSRRKVQAGKLLLEDYFDEVSKYKFDNSHYQINVLIPESKYPSLPMRLATKNRLADSRTNFPLHW